MGRATDPGENHDPGKDQRFTPSLTQEPRLENGLGHGPPPAGPRSRSASNATADIAVTHPLGSSAPIADIAPTGRDIEAAPDSFADMHWFIAVEASEE